MPRTEGIGRCCKRLYLDSATERSVGDHCSLRSEGGKKGYLSPETAIPLSVAEEGVLWRIQEDVTKDTQDTEA